MRRVIVFDGVCRLCNGTVDFVVRRDPKRLFQFASLQSSVGKKLLGEVGVLVSPDDEFETVYLVEGDQYFTKSTAALHILKKMKFPWPLLYVGIVVPRFARDGLYNLVGRNRKKWFGETTTCDVRREEAERSRFLD